MGRSEGPKGLFMALVGAAAGVAGTAAYTRYALGEMPRYLKLYDEVFDNPKANEVTPEKQIELNKEHIALLERYIWYMHNKLGLLLPNESPFKDREEAIKAGINLEEMREHLKKLERTKAGKSVAGVEA
jgi:hypothetical protein